MIYQDMIAFLFKKKGAQITGTKIVRGYALSGTNNKYQVQKYFFLASCSTAGWNLEKPKGAVSVNHKHNNKQQFTTLTSYKVPLPNAAFDNFFPTPIGIPDFTDSRFHRSPSMPS